MHYIRFGAVVVVLAIQTAVSFGADLYVSPSGNDASQGTKDKPFATLQRAQKSVRESKVRGKEPIAVHLRGGTYYLAEPLVFTVADSGSERATVVWEVVTGENAIVSGGVKLDLKWEPFKDGILKAQVPGDVQFDQLFVNGQRQILARYPNFKPGELLDGFSADSLSPDRVKRWAQPAGAFVHGLSGHHWGSLHYRVTGADANGKLQMEGGWQINRDSQLHGQNRYVENVFEELDAPGEWYLDAAQRTLYFWPPAGIAMDKARVEVPHLKHLIEVRGSATAPVRGIVFKGLTFAHTARTFMETKEPLLRGDWCIYRGGAVLIEGAEDCAVLDCDFDALGGNGVFLSRFNRRVNVTGCKFTDLGASAICVVGSPDAVRSPQFWNKTLPADKIDRTPGPMGPDYPSHCRIADNLITNIGRVEKQVAGVCLSMSEEITVSHNSIYRVPRAGINVNDGTWGGHVIEFNDVFDTVLETGDHGSFNSWGRDRFWGINDAPLRKSLAFLDARKPTILRNNRWRCDHGWDIDLDDGSSNYRLENNLCLNGGLKNREGYSRTDQNNITVNNTFHPHVWYDQSDDIFVRNIVMRWYAPIGMPKVWGQEVDHNLLPDEAALKRSHETGLDPNSSAADPKFISPAIGDFRVSTNSPALLLGFRNFAMDQFGVVSPRLRAEVRTPLLPNGKSAPRPEQSQRDSRPRAWLGAQIKNVVGLGEVSATGLPGEIGVLVIEVPANSFAAKAGLRQTDVILQCDGQPVNTVADLLRQINSPPPAGHAVALEIFRDQKTLTIRFSGPR